MVSRAKFDNSRMRSMTSADWEDGDSAAKRGRFVLRREEDDDVVVAGLIRGFATGGAREIDELPTYKHTLSSIRECEDRFKQNSHHYQYTPAVQR